MITLSYLICYYPLNNFINVHNATVLFGRINYPFKGILIAGQTQQFVCPHLRPHSAKLNKVDPAGYSTKLTRGQPAPGLRSNHSCTLLYTTFDRKVTPFVELKTGYHFNIPSFIVQNILIKQQFFFSFLCNTQLIKI